MEMTIAIISLVVSLVTLWITYLHRGKVKMTRPTIICFAFEGIKGEPKIFLRTLLYSSSKQGIIVESLFLKLRKDESTQVFSVWAYGDKGVVRGSGIYVGEQGVEVYHHFIVPKTEKDYKFLSGLYDVEIYAVVKEKKIKLYKLQLEITKEMAETLSYSTVGIFFDWSPELNTYLSHTEIPSPGKLAQLLS